MAGFNAKKHFKKAEKLSRAEQALLDKLVGKPQSKADWLILVSLIPHQEFVWKARTTEVAACLGISRAKAYALLGEAEKCGITIGSQTSDDYADSAERGTTRKFSSAAIVWEVVIKDSKGRYMHPKDGGYWDGTSDLEPLVKQMRRNLKRHGIE